MRKPITRLRAAALLLAVLFTGAYPGSRVQAAGEPTEEELQARFKQGYALFEAGQYRKALATFESIRKADPDARGSLLLSGMAHLQLFEFAESADCFRRFLQLEPAHVSGLVGGIKAHQAIGDEEAVEKYRQALFRLKSTQADPRLEVMLNYEREMISLGGGLRLSILETFPGVESSVLYQALVLRGKAVVRRLEWIRAEGPVRKAVEALHPDRSHQTIFVLAETGGDSDGGDDYKMHEVAFESLDYSRARQAFLKVVKVP